jgi:hypothetical protein
MFSPAGRIAFESAAGSGVRNDDMNDGCPWGSARLKFDLVAMIDDPEDLSLAVRSLWKYAPCWI